MGQWHLQAIVISYSLSTFCSYTIVTYLSVNIPLISYGSSDGPGGSGMKIALQLSRSCARGRVPEVLTIAIKGAK